MSFDKKVNLDNSFFSNGKFDALFSVENIMFEMNK